MSRRENNFHVVWCGNRKSGEKHSRDTPYCYKLIRGIVLIPLDGEQFPPQLWVEATSAAHPCALESGQRVDNDHRFNGIGLAVNKHDGDDWAEETFRLTADAARSLAATLIRAADIQQGLTR